MTPLSKKRCLKLSVPHLCKSYERKKRKQSARKWFNFSVSDNGTKMQLLCMSPPQDSMNQQQNPANVNNDPNFYPMMQQLPQGLPATMYNQPQQPMMYQNFTAYDFHPQQQVQQQPQQITQLPPQQITQLQPQQITQLPQQYAQQPSFSNPRNQGMYNYYYDQAQQQPQPQQQVQQQSSYGKSRAAEQNQTFNTGLPKFSDFYEQAQQQQPQQDLSNQIVPISMQMSPSAATMYYNSQPANPSPSAFPVPSLEIPMSMQTNSDYSQQYYYPEQSSSSSSSTSFASFTGYPSPYDLAASMIHQIGSQQQQPQSHDVPEQQMLPSFRELTTQLSGPTVPSVSPNPAGPESENQRITGNTRPANDISQVFFGHHVNHNPHFQP